MKDIRTGWGDVLLLLWVCLWDASIHHWLALKEWRTRVQHTEIPFKSPVQILLRHPVVFESICYCTRANRLRNESNTTAALRKIWTGRRAKFYTLAVLLVCTLVQSSCIRVDVPSYKNIMTDKREQYNWMSGKKNWTARRYVWHWTVYSPSKFFSALPSVCSRLSVGLLWYDSRSTLRRLHQREKFGRVVHATTSLFWRRSTTHSKLIESVASEEDGWMDRVRQLFCLISRCCWMHAACWVKRTPYLGSIQRNLRTRGFRLWVLCKMRSYMEGFFSIYVPTAQREPVKILWPLLCTLPLQYASKPDGTCRLAVKKGP